jgi:hypothetical protein
MDTKKKIILGLVVFVFLVIGFAVMIANYTYSEGFRAGTIVKVTKKGFVFKTTEGELNVGGIQARDASSIWHFSVAGSTHDEVVKQLEAAALSNQRVKLYYEEKLFKFVPRGDTKYIVVRVETVP